MMIMDLLKRIQRSRAELVTGQTLLRTAAFVLRREGYCEFADALVEQAEEFWRAMDELPCAKPPAARPAV